MLIRYNLETNKLFELFTYMSNQINDLKAEIEELREEVTNYKEYNNELEAQSNNDDDDDWGNDD